MVFNKNFVGKTGVLYVLDALGKRVHNVELSAGFVVLLGGNADNKVVAQFLCALEQIPMSLVEQVKGAVGDDFFH